MKKWFIGLLILMLCISCSSSSNRTSILVDDDVYKTYNISKEAASIIHVPRIDGYDKLRDYIVIVNESSVDISELVLAYAGTKGTRSGNWKPFVGVYDDVNVQNVDTPVVFLEHFETIPSGKKKKLDLNKGVQVRDMRYLIFSANTEKPVTVYNARESKHDLYLYVTDQK